MTEPVDVTPPPAAKNYAFADYLFQFITITAGVLIALLINGVVELNNNRRLVADARATIAREIADNKQDMDKTLAGIQGDLAKLETAIKFANDMLTDQENQHQQARFSPQHGRLSSSAWRTAERTGALSYMDYAEVQRYPKLYDFQDLIWNGSAICSASWPRRRLFSRPVSILTSRTPRISSCFVSA